MKTSKVSKVCVNASLKVAEGVCVSSGAALKGIAYAIDYAGDKCMSGGASVRAKRKEIDKAIAADEIDAYLGSIKDRMAKAKAKLSSKVDDVKSSKVFEKRTPEKDAEMMAMAQKIADSRLSSN